MARHQITASASGTDERRTAPLKIGITARLMHNPPQELGFRNKKLQYLEQSIAHWILAEGALAFMLPTLGGTDGLRRSAVRVSDQIKAVDGLVLQGGADVSPESYGETALRPEWAGDRARDLYELDLIWECIIQGKPVLGICRGCQLLNVAFGGTLWQDVQTQVAGAAIHVDSQAYDQHQHPIEYAPGSILQRLYPLHTNPQVISIHHQAIKEPGAGVILEATSVEDKVVEAIRWGGKSFVYGVQWHPEFHPPGDTQLLDSTPLLGEFLRQVARRAAA